jgi:hypothetical protein
MVIITFLTFLLGIIRYRYWAYWKWALILLAWQFIGSIFFAGGGTLENPAGDGIIAHQIRLATNDGPGMAVFGVLFLIVFYGGVIWLIRRMYLAVKEHGKPASGTPTVAVSRKVVEVFGLLLVMGAFVYWQYADRLGPHSKFTISQDVTGARSADQEASDPISRQLGEVAAEITAKGPQKLDPITTLESASAEGRTLTYHNRLSRRDDSDQELVAFVRKTVLPKVCGNSDLRDGIDNYGITYRYSYSFPNGNAPVAVSICSSMCGTMNLRRWERPDGIAM